MRIINNSLMKKTLFIIAGIIAFGSVIYAQAPVVNTPDTVPFGQFDGYYINGDVPKLDELQYTHIGNMSAPGCPGGETAKRFLSPDTLTVYGIAAGVKQIAVGAFLDTSTLNSIEYLRLYLPSADTLQYIRQAPVHLKHNVSYYLDCDTVNPPQSRMVVEMHEQYFSTPVTVADSFYVGVTQYLLTSVSDVGYGALYPCPPLRVAAIMSVSLYNIEDCIIRFSHATDPSVWARVQSTNDFSLIFPILTPPPSMGRDTTHFGGDTTAMGDTVIVTDTTIVIDTVIIGNDTIITYDTVVTYDTILAIPDAGLLGRLTGVMPNPAAETAKVVSSFGVKRVEAYNMAGEKVHDQRVPDGSLSATLDVRRWPAGAYILRIHTPRGVTAKKLTVRR